MKWRANPILRDALAGDLPPWADRFVRHVGSAVHRFSMIGDKDHVLVGVSGGKDSLALSLALELRRRRVRDRYRLSAVLIDWEERPLSKEAQRNLASFFALLELPFEIRSGSLSEAARDSEAGCYECARARKRELFRAAREKGATKIALGHHLDDFSETLLMNLALHGRFEGMDPVRSFFGGAAEIIRPLCEIREGTLRTVSDRLGLPVVESECPGSFRNPRTKMKSIIAEMMKIDRLVREHVFSAYIRDSRRDTDGSGTGE